MQKTKKTQTKDSNKKNLDQTPEINKTSFKEAHCHLYKHNSFIIATLLIFIGITLILNNLGILPWTVWAHLWRFWPVFIVFIGLRVILGNTLVSDIVLSIIVLLLLISIWFKAIVDINLPLIYQLNLDHWHWYNFIKQF